MGRILLVSAGRTGLRRLCVGLIQRLEKAGHTCALAVPEDVARAHPGEVARLLPFQTQRPVPPPASWLARLRTVGARRQAAVDALVDPEFLERARVFAPDVILVEVELPEYVIATSGLEVPVGLLCSFIAPYDRLGVPPLHTSIVPGTEGGDEGSIRRAWREYRAWKRKERLRRRMRAPASARVDLLRLLADRYGFPHREEFDLDAWLYPLDFRSLPHLNLNPAAFDFPHDVHPAHTYVGVPFPADDPRNEVPEALLGLMERSPKRPLIYCAFGTAFADEEDPFLELALGAFAERPDWDVVVALGRRSLAELPPTPDHVRVVDWAPQRLLLGRADVAVLHAGPASLYECLVARTPLVAYPFEVNDQLGYGARVAFHGLGQVGDRSTETATDLIGRVERALAGDGMDDARERMAAAILQDDDDDVAVQTIERWMTEGAR